MKRPLHILSGGAAQGLVGSVQPAFESAHGVTLMGTYGAVGAMREKLLAGEPCDVAILTAALIASLEADGHVVKGSARAVGVVKTGVALKSAAPRVEIRSQEDLKQLLSGATSIHFPDPAKATAGIHFMKVLTALGLDKDVSRHRTYPNGATAMAALAKAEDGAVGCTQVTEILYTQGVQLTGLLPPPFELATTYTAAVCAKAKAPEAAQALVAVLCSGEAAAYRRAGGFE